MLPRSMVKAKGRALEKHKSRNRSGEYVESEAWAYRSSVPRAAHVVHGRTTGLLVVGLQRWLGQADRGILPHDGEAGDREPGWYVLGLCR